MPEAAQTNLATLFEAALATLRQNQEALNQADPFNGNHGDHMVEIFETAVQAARQSDPSNLALAMEQASLMLTGLEDNGSARLYARGLKQFASQFRQHEVTLNDLLAYGQNLLREKDKTGERAAGSSADSGAILKALASGLAGWSRAENEPARGLDLGILFELGMAYLQAKQRGGTKTEILAEAASSASPLGAIPHRHQSGKLAIGAILKGMQSPD
jgi:hypothetical protein